MAGEALLSCTCTTPTLEQSTLWQPNANKRRTIAENRETLRVETEAPARWQSFTVEIENFWRDFGAHANESAEH